MTAEERARQEGLLDEQKTPEQLAAEAAAAGGGAGAGGGDGGAGDKGQPTFKDEDVLSYLKTTAGVEFSSIDDVKGLKDRLTEHQELVSLRKSMEDERNNFQKPFANETVENFNNFVKSTGINNYNLFMRIANVDPEKLSGIDILAIKNVIDMPDLSDDYDLVRRRIEKDYPLLSDPEANTEDEEYKLEALKLKMNAKEGMDKILSVKEKIAQREPGFTPEKEQELKKTWEPVLPKLMEALSKHEFTLAGDEKFTYALSEEQSKQYQAQLEEYVMSRRLPATKETLQSAAAYMIARMRSENMDSIIKGVVDHVSSNEVRERILKYNNPDFKKAEGGEAPTGDLTQEQLYEKIYGRKPGV